MPELLKTILVNSSNLKFYGRFESGALTTDSSGNSHTLTAIGDPAETTGVFGGGVELDGDDGYSMTDHADLKPTTAYTFGARIKSTANDVYFFSNSEINTGTNDYSGFQFAIASNGFRVAHYTSNGTTATTTVTTSKVVNDGAWHLVIASWDGTTVRLYVDGKYETGGAIAAPSFDTTSSPRVGCRVVNGSNATFFTGSLDDMFLFNGTALSADQIKELYEGHIYGELRPNQFGTTAGLWHLNGNSTDFSGNNNHGTDTAITYSVANGRFGQGAGFNGSTSKIVVTSFSSSGTTHSYSCRFKTSSTAQQYMLEHYASSSSELTIQINLNKIYVGTWNGSSASNVITDGTYNDGMWHHLVVVRATTTSSIYVDGVLVKSGSSNNITVGGTFCIGRDNINNQTSFNGSIEEVFVIPTALTANQIRQIYAYQRGLLGRYA